MLPVYIFMTRCMSQYSKPIRTPATRSFAKTIPDRFCLGCWAFAQGFQTLIGYLAPCVIKCSVEDDIDKRLAVFEVLLCREGCCAYVPHTLLVFKLLSSILAWRCLPITDKG